MNLKTEWKDLWRDLQVGGSGDEIFALLEQKYGETHRKYHTLEHIASCLALFPLVRPHCFVPEAVRLALWFHDAVYNPQRHDNEEKSAEFFSECFQGKYLYRRFMELTQDLILATKHINPMVGGTKRALIELDLSILGASEAEYDKYEQGIRQEYGFIPDEAFYPRRAKFMLAIEARDPIFHIPEMKSRFEKQAHDNIRRALARYPTSPV